MTLDCETVPHVTLKSIAQNSALDSIFAKHKPTLDEKLKVLNGAPGKVDSRQKSANAWEKLAKAVKVIEPRSNEAMRVMRPDGAAGGY